MPSVKKALSKPLTLCLHLGAHKTASTHIQRTLRSNAPLLDAQQIKVFGPDYLRRPGQNLFHLFGLFPAGDPPKTPPRERFAQMAEGAERVIFTEENFWGGLRPRPQDEGRRIYPEAEERIARLIEAVGPVRLKLLFAVRDPIDYITSAYSQALVMDHIEPFEDFLARNSVERVDWLDLTRRIAALEGVFRIHVWRYEDYAEVQQRMFRRLLGWKVGVRVAPYSKRVNQGLSEVAVKTLLDWQAKGREGGLARRIRDLHPVSEEAPRFQPFDADEVAASRDWYDRQVAQIAELPRVDLIRPKPVGGA